MIRGTPWWWGLNEEAREQGSLQCISLSPESRRKGAGKDERERDTGKGRERRMKGVKKLGQEKCMWDGKGWGVVKKGCWRSLQPQRWLTWIKAERKSHGSTQCHLFPHGCWNSSNHPKSLPLASMKPLCKWMKMPSLGRQSTLSKWLHNQMAQKSGYQSVLNPFV